MTPRGSGRPIAPRCRGHHGYHQHQQPEPELSYDAQARLVQVTLGSPVTQTVSLAYNAFGQRAGYSVTPAGAGQPSLAESFKYQGDQLAQVAYTGTSITTPYTDTYVYSQDGSPLELLRQTASSTTPYWYVLDGQANVVGSYAYDQWGKLASSSESVPPGYPRSGSSAMPAAGTTTSWPGIG